jgi:hypothetical protein
VRVGVWYRIHDDVDIRSLRSCTLEENRLVDLWFLVLNPWRHLVSDYTLEIIVKYFWFLVPNPCRHFVCYFTALRPYSRLSTFIIPKLVGSYRTSTVP